MEIQIKDVLLQSYKNNNVHFIHVKRAFMKTKLYIPYKFSLQIFPTHTRATDLRIVNLGEKLDLPYLVTDTFGS